MITLSEVLQATKGFCLGEKDALSGAFPAVSETGTVAAQEEEAARKKGAQPVDKTEEIRFTGVSTDTRTLRPGELFIALQGERFDGHAYAAAAAAKGAAAVVVSRRVPVPSFVPRILVKDTLQAYQDIAGFYRRSLPGLKVVAVTGSNGKTSTKDLIAAVLATRYRVSKTQGNFNNEIGLPQTLLQIPPETEIAVTEMGMRGLGQIKAMCSFARPDVAVITNVGSTHVGELGSLDNIAKAKSEILEDLPQDGFAVLNGDLPRVRAMKAKLQVPVSWFGMAPEDDVRAEEVRITAQGSNFRCKAGAEEATFFLPLIGAHQVMNALAAIAVGLHFGVKLNDMKNALAGVRITDGRQQVLQFGPYTVIDDAYNASPASMEAAFAMLAKLKQGASTPCRAIAVVADMLELGDTSREAHASVGRMAAASATDFLLGYGPETVATVAAAKEAGVDARYFAGKDEAAAALRTLLQPGDIVLLKGSHSMQVGSLVTLVFKAPVNADSRGE